MAAICVGEVA